jgi:hypothetical protein
MMKVIVHQNECVELYSVDCLMRSNTQRGTLSKLRITNPFFPPDPKIPADPFSSSSLIAFYPTGLARW